LSPFSGPLPYYFNDSNFIDSKSEQDTIFEVSDVEVNTVCTTKSDYTANSALIYGVEGPSESEQEIEESNLTYKEEQDVNYMIPVPKQGTPRARDISLTPITIMVVDTMELKKSRALLNVLFDPG